MCEINYCIYIALHNLTRGSRQRAALRSPKVILCWVGSRSHPAGVEAQCHRNAKQINLSQRFMELLHVCYSDPAPIILRLGSKPGTNSQLCHHCISQLCIKKGLVVGLQVGDLGGRSSNGSRSKCSSKETPKYSKHVYSRSSKRTGSIPHRVTSRQHFLTATGMVKGASLGAQ